jgi:hypothetical protein
MKTPRTSLVLLFLMRFVLLVIGASVVAMPKLALADDIVDYDTEDVSDFCDDEEECSVTTISAILDSTDATQIYIEMESYTDNDDLYDVYGWAEGVAGDLYADDDVIWDDSDSDPYDADVLGEAPIDLTDGEVAFAFPVGGYLLDDDGDVEEVAAAEADVNLGPPEITSTSPPYVYVGTSGSLTINGNDLITPFLTSSTTTQATKSGGTGLTVTAGSFSSTQGSATYDAALTATTGTWSIGVSYSLGGTILIGVNNGFTVGDRTPSVTSVDPDQWTAGQLNFPVTISGSYFGSNPQLTVSGGGATATITGHTDNGQAGGASITANASVPNACDAAGTVTLTVISTGYNGTGFTPAYSGESDSDTGTATIVASPRALDTLDAPQITFGGKNVAGTTTSVVVGQQIALTGVVPTQACVSVSNWTWTPPSGAAGTAIGGYTPTFTSYATASVTALPATTANPYTFYWVYPGTYTVSTKYTLTNGQTSPMSTATFTVQGITSGSMKSSLGQKSDVALGTFVDNCTGDSNYKNDVTWLSLGQYTAESGTSPSCAFTIPTPGISFSASGSTPKGSRFFVQLLTQNTVNVTTTAGNTSGNCGTGLDNFYPYAKNTSTTSTSDSPGNLVNPAPKGTTYTEISRSFGASMYAMWQSNTANSIPVPIGYVPWTTLMDGLRSAKGAWSVAPDSTASPGTFTAAAASQASSGYPTWTTKVANGACTSYNIGTTD